tara:strand:- start:284 stop:457 length:174 start_codon:yes stop_codon:yes gene_type:complete
MGDKIEEFLYKAHNEGIRKEVFLESAKLVIKHPHMTVGDRYEIAYNNVRKKIKKNEK